MTQDTCSILIIVPFQTACKSSGLSRVMKEHSVEFLSIFTERSLRVFVTMELWEEVVGKLPGHDCNLILGVKFLYLIKNFLWKQRVVTSSNGKMMSRVPMATVIKLNEVLLLLFHCQGICWLSVHRFCTVFCRLKYIITMVTGSRVNHGNDKYYHHGDS